MTIVEIKGEGRRKNINFYYNKRSKSHLTTFIDQDFNSLVRLLFDLKREGFPIDKAIEYYLNKERQNDWMF